MKKETSEAILETLKQIVQRREGESQGAFTAFLVYCSLLPKERLGNKVLEIVSEKTGLTQITVNQYRAQNEWDRRVSQVEAQRWIREESDRQEQIAQDNKKFVAQNRKIKETANEISLDMIETASNLLKKAKVADETLETGFVETKDGRTVPTHTTINIKAKVSDIPRLVEAAFKVQRYVQDLPTELVEQEIPFGADLSRLSADELIAIREKNQRALREMGAMGKVQTLSDKEQ